MSLSLITHSTSTSGTNFQINSNKQEYLEKALTCIKQDTKGSPGTPIILGRIAVAFQKSNPTKASEIFQQMVSSLEKIKEGRQSDNVRQVHATAIYFLSIKSEEDAIQAIVSLENNYAGLATMVFFLNLYAVKGSPLIAQCKKKFEKIETENDYQTISFAQAFVNLDSDYCEKVLSQIKNTDALTKAIIRLTKAGKKPIAMKLMDQALSLIEIELNKNPENNELLLNKLQLQLISGISLEEIQKWISFFSAQEKNIYSKEPRDEALSNLAVHLKNDHFHRSLEICMMCSDPYDAMSKLLLESTPGQVEAAKPYINTLCNPLERTELWISIIQRMEKRYHEYVRGVLPEIIALLETCPDGKELDWKPGWGRKQDAYVSFERQKGALMHQIIQVHFNVGAIDQVEKLKNHPLLDLFSYTCMTAEFYRKNEPEKAEKCYEEALVINERCQDIKRNIALRMIKLNPARALTLLLEAGSSFTQSSDLFRLAKVASKSNPELALRCIEHMHNCWRASPVDEAAACLALANVCGNRLSIYKILRL